MFATTHFETRCKQRHIADHEVKTALQFGIRVRDKNTLGEKSCLALIKAVELWVEEIQTAKKTGILELQ